MIKRRVVVKALLDYNKGSQPWEPAVCFPTSLGELEVITTDYSNELPNFHILSKDAAFLELVWNCTLCDFRICIGKFSAWISLQEGYDSAITSAVTAPTRLTERNGKDKEKHNKTIVSKRCLLYLPPSCPECFH